jgi:RND superfamily putative drug exporter
MFASLARACLRHRWIVIGVWVGLLVVINGIASSAGADWRTDFVLPDSESKDVQELLEANDPNRAGFAGQIVVKADQGITDPEVEAAFTEIMDFAAEQEGVTVTSPYDNAEQISESGEIAYAQLDISDRGFEEITQLGTDIEEFADSQPAVQGMQVEYGGDPFSEFELPESEIYGIIAAVIILILAFGSVLAMGLPIGTALFGLGIASALVSLLSHLIPIPDFTTAMVAMIGLGVGIDYALFIVTRYREGLRLNLSVEQAVVESMDTSGRAVLFAGVTVIISLMGLSLMGLSFVQGIAIAASIGVLLMILGSLTLLPALLGWIGTRIDHTTRAALGAVALGVIGAFFGVLTKQAGIFIFGMLAAVVLFASSFFIKALRKEVPRRQEPVNEQRMWYRWSRFIQHRPWPSLLGAAGLLIVLAIPLFGIRLGFGDYGNYNEDQTVRRAYDLLAEGFGPGTNGPMFITVEGEAASDQAALGAFVDELNNTENVATAFPTPINDTLALVIVNPQSAPQDAETSTLVNHLRDEVIPASGLDAKVGGWTAASSDFADYMGDRMPLLIGVVLLLSFLLLMVVFRSLLVPLKAVVMNLLSIGAAYGILVAIFQWGWGLGLIGVDRSGPIEAWVPMFLFAIVFGLSMDYEVFLLSRIREEYDRTKNNAVAVADGLASTARVITAAALIMFCVFGAFALGDDRQLKLFGLGLGIAVLLDATIVRMVLVPATMELLGDRNWWLPKWLDRILPRIKVEGEHHVAPVPAHILEGDDVEREPELTR